MGSGNRTEVLTFWRVHECSRRYGSADYEIPTPSQIPPPRKEAANHADAGEADDVARRDMEVRLAVALRSVASAGVRAATEVAGRTLRDTDQGGAEGADNNTR